MRAAADHVLAGAPLQELRDRIDALAVDYEVWEAEMEAAHRKNAARPVELPKSLDMPSLTATLGAPAAKRCQAGFSAMLMALEKLHPAFKALPIESILSQAKAGREHLQGTPYEVQKPRTLIDLIYDVNIGSAARAAMMKLQRSLTAALVIARAEEHGQRIAPWLALALADIWAEAFEQCLEVVSDSTSFIEWVGQLFASIGDGMELHKAIDRWRREAAAEGSGVYWPLSESGEVQ